MKIVFPRMETFQFHEAYDGGSKFIQFLAEELVKRGVEAEIVTTKIRGKENFTSAMHNGVSYKFISPFYTGKRIIPFNMFYKLRFSRNLARYLEKYDFDILHSTEAFSYHYLHKKERKPVVFQCWALEPWYGKEPLAQKGIKKLYVKLFLQKPWGYCIRKSDSIAADDIFQLPRITALGVDEKKVWYIPNGIPYKKIQEQGNKFHNKRKDLGFDKGDFVILSVCQIAPDKGIEDIIEAFSMIKKKIPESKLIMIGKGILEEKMHQLIKENNLEKDVVHRKNIPEEDLYNYHFSSDLFVSAVTSEDFMISIQEGMAAGLPIISSAQPYLVKEGMNGYVVGFNNSLGIARAIEKIYKSKEREKMGKLSRKMAEKYDYNNLAETALGEYEKLIRKNSRIL